MVSGVSCGGEPVLRCSLITSLTSPSPLSCGRPGRAEARESCPAGILCAASVRPAQPPQTGRRGIGAKGPTRKGPGPGTSPHTTLQSRRDGGGGEATWKKGPDTRNPLPHEPGAGGRSHVQNKLQADAAGERALPAAPAFFAQIRGSAVRGSTSRAT